MTYRTVFLTCGLLLASAAKIEAQSPELSSREIAALNLVSEVFEIPPITLEAAETKRIGSRTMIQSNGVFAAVSTTDDPYIKSWGDANVMTETADFTASPFRVDEASWWDWAEQKMRRITDIDVLERRRFRLSPGALKGSQAPSVTFEWEADYYGYPADGGSYVSLRVRKRDGKLMELWNTRGIQAEPPSIKVSQKEALELASKATGWDPAGMNAVLRYVGKGLFGPAKVPPQLTLSYSVSCSNGSIEVNAATGEVSKAYVPAIPPGTVLTTKKVALPKPPPPRRKSSAPKVPPPAPVGKSSLSLWVLGPALALLATFGAWIWTRRR